MDATLAAATRARSIEQPVFTGMPIHLIGIGGAGMSGAAAMLLKLGAKVAGSDLQPFEGLGGLVSSGARVAIGHDASHLDPSAELVVVSAAIPQDNPEFASARRRGLRVVKYAELLGWLMAHRVGVAIAGTHGKTTTTAMCAHIYRTAGLAPSFVCGASSHQLGGSSGVGSGPHFIVEACEYDRSFLHFYPASAAILNLEADHLDCYRDFREIVDTFARFARQVDSGGLLVCNAEDQHAIEAAGHARATVETFGFNHGADWRAENLKGDCGRYALDVTFRGSTVLSTRLAVPGRHNVANALAATALAHHAGISPRDIARAISTFSGVSRRLTWRGKPAGVNIVDDYAHHPTEIRVTIEAVNHAYRPKRTWVVFQPHQQARTRHMMDEFAGSFGSADEVIVPDIFGAREENSRDKPAGSEELVSRIRGNGGRAHYLPSLAEAAEHVVSHVSDGDVVVTMGAGDVWKVADELVERIRRGD